MIVENVWVFLQISAVFPDADECANNATNGCEHICENTVNGYKYVTVYNYVWQYNDI